MSLFSEIIWPFVYKFPVGCVRRSHLIHSITTIEKVRKEKMQTACSFEYHPNMGMEDGLGLQPGVVK